ncbi:ABC transporter permease [Pseudarthrobacter sp. B4EP4b]|uniref:ABC transporter permease n=1 Tax=Pseudarthrobacter sp. B4EP4b TaxID=2590664 RepID=UPI00114ED138|nr:ABC transporter permease [Pseudarthrobacter sp. B4EP4b]
MAALRNIAGRRIIGALVVAGSLVAWELASLSGLLPDSIFPRMTSTFGALVELFQDPAFWSSFAQTIASWLIGIVIAAVGGVPVGMVLGRVTFLYNSSRLLIDFLRTIPAVAVIPLITLLFGATMEMKVILVVYGAFWPIMLQTAYGVRDTDRVLMDTARSYGLTGLRTARFVLAPSALPYLVTGMRISAVVGLLLAISSEILGSAPGIGLDLALAQTGGALTLTYAYVVFIGLLGVCVDFGLNKISRSVLFWHPSVREEAS